MNEQDPYAELMRLTNGYQVTQAIYAAATLGIADLLEDEPRESDSIAAEVGVHPASLYRLLRALASIGVFHEKADQRFALTAIGRCLRSDADRSIGPWAKLVGRPYHWSAWGNLLHGVQTGETPFNHVYGMDAWEYRSHHPKEGEIFDRAMTGMSRRMTKAIVSGFNFSGFRRIVDVGGGHGALLAAILTAHPSARGVLFDQSGVVAGAVAMLQEAGVADRCEIVGGNFFEQVPEGGDAYLLKTVLHDWDDAKARVILRACRQSIGPEGRLLVLERLVALPNEDPEVKFFDLMMMTMMGGRQRTRAEFATLFAEAGFHLDAVTSTGTPLCVIEGWPV